MRRYDRSAVGCLAMILISVVASVLLTVVVNVLARL
jgi:hypothetical protein